MSQEFLDPEILADFFVEAKEHLETIEPNLLELEKNPGNLGLLNEIFRPMHSLKGASGFLGLNKINQLAHKAENILDEMRQGNMAMTSGCMDVILSATDALRTMVENLQASGSEGAVDVGPIIGRIEAILAGEVPPPAPESPAPAPEPPAPEEPPAPAPAAPATPPAGAKPRLRFEPDPSFQAVPYALTTVGEGHLTDFLEEALDIIENLNGSLLALEDAPHQGGELVNDIFRYFHNLKGNSGIIGFKELNSLTHEAETLLNRVRKNEIPVSQEMIDLLLSVVDLIEALVGKIDAAGGKVTPMDTSVLVRALQKAAEDGEVTAELLEAVGKRPHAKAPAAEAPAAEPEPVAPEPAAEEPKPAGGYDPEDVAIFEQTVEQQLANMAVALEELRKDASQTEYANGLFRALQTLQNSSGYMGLEELKKYAERTAGLVDQGRKATVGFEMLLDILGQELAILKELARTGLAAVKGEAPAPAAPEPMPEPVAEPTPPATAPAPEPKPVPVPEPPAAAPAPRPEPRPAPRPAAKPPPPARPAAEKPAEPPAEAAEAGSPAGGGPKPKVSTTIRVDHQKLDHLMNLIGELIINRNRYTLLARDLEEGAQEVHTVAQQLTETTYAMARISDDLQDTIMKVRMVPVQTVFTRFPRLVRDLSRKSGKSIELIMEGEETEMDKSVVEEIGDPLVHLVRNAVDHGLETEEERLAAGKSATGHVWLRAYHKGNSVAIEVEDDGKGIDPEKMREVAVRKGVISAEEAKALSDREALELIYAPGFSSAERITDISGRGVGMDVVKTNIKHLKGSVQTASVVGKGSKFTLSLPLTLAIIDVLMVVIGEDRYAIPLDAVSETTKIETAKFTEVNKRKAVTLRGEVLGVLELAELLGLPKNTAERDILPVVVIHDNDRRLGLVVDRLLERQEIVIKPLGQYLNRFNIRGISGATILGDGSVVLILDPHEIYNLAAVQKKVG
jgi:two-component system chemotaxis sensor kinase CheA